MQTLEIDSLDDAVRSIDDLIELTHSSRLKLATLLLRMAKLEIQIKTNDITPEEVDALSLRIERHFNQAEIVEMPRPQVRERSRTRR